MNWYWLRSKKGGWPVTFHITEDVRFSWTRIHGVQIGRWFIGAIQARKEPSR
jgi:hypothetical protein